MTTQLHLIHMGFASKFYNLLPMTRGKRMEWAEIIWEFMTISSRKQKVTRYYTHPHHLYLYIVRKCKTINFFIY